MKCPAMTFLVLAILTGVSCCAHAQPFGIDFHDVGTNPRVQGGAFNTFTVSGTSGANGVSPQTQSFGGIDVSLGFVNVRDRDLVGSTNPPGFQNLLEDAVFANGGVNISLDGLTPGNYRVTTYHHDSGGTANVWGVGVTASDSLDTNVRRAFNTTTTASSGAAANVAFRTITFDLFADGVDDNFTILGIGSGAGRGWVNGFLIEEAPAVATIRANVGNGDAKKVSGWDAHIANNTANGEPANSGDPLLNNLAPVSRHFIADFADPAVGAVQATISAAALSARSQRGSGSPDLTESLFFSQSGPLSLEFENLTAGIYELTTYHFDPVTTGGALTGTTNIEVDVNGDGIFDLFDTDADGTDDGLLLAFVGTAGDPSATYRFSVPLGFDEATIRFSDNDLLNAYELTQIEPFVAVVPEPMTLVMFMLLATFTAGWYHAGVWRGRSPLFGKR